MKSHDQNKDQTLNKWQKIFLRIDWPVAIFLVLNPLLGLITASIYYYNYSLNTQILIFALILAAATNLSITAGYHRLFSHRSYEAHPLIRFIFLFIGASAFQGSALKWSADHRQHHSKVDTEADPYSITKGFWYAHMGWLFLKDSTDHNPRAPDLEKDGILRHQHRYYVGWAIVAGFVFPALVGYFLGSLFQGVLVAGALRIALTQQSTFLVNSLCHTLGKKTYSDKISARDSFIVALLTHGEGYHNFHHQFQLDYRNGIRWYQWDPTKWTIRFLAFLGLAKKLRRISQQEILKARLQMESLQLVSRGMKQEIVDQLKERVLAAQLAFKKVQDEYELKKSELTGSSQIQQAKAKIYRLKYGIEVKKAEFKASLQIWRAHTRRLQYMKLNN